MKGMKVRPRVSDRTIGDAVEREPGATLAALAERVGRDRSRVNRISARLERLGLVRRDHTDAGLRLFPAGQMPVSVSQGGRSVVTESA